MTAKRRSPVQKKQSKGPTKPDIAASEKPASKSEAPNQCQAGSNISELASEELILRELSFIKRLKGISCLPEIEWQTASLPILREHLGRIPSPQEAAEILEFYRGEMTAHSMRLTRAVQPVGTPYLLSPIIGSIRLNDAGVDHAVQFLVNHMISAVRQSRSHVFRQLEELSSYPLGRHRNYLIWKAIDEMMSNKAEGVGDPYGKDQLTIAFLPFSDHVKRYVEIRATRDRKSPYANLPKDGKAWTRLWEDSGAGMIIQKSKTKSLYEAPPLSTIG